MAGAELMVIRVRQRRFADADVVFESLAKRHQQEKVIGHVPQDAVNRIVLAYLGDFGNISLFVKSMRKKFMTGTKA